MTLAEQVSSNVRYLAKQNKVNIGDIEKECGVSTGYFSRKAHEEDISLQVTFKVAELFGISLDMLCTNFRYEKLREEARECGYALVPLEPATAECEKNGR